MLKKDYTNKTYSMKNTTLKKLDKHSYESGLKKSAIVNKAVELFLQAGDKK